MADARPPPTELGSQTRFGLHLSDGLLTVWIHHRNLGFQDATWELLDQYEIEDRVELTGAGRLIKEGEEVWYLVDKLEDIHLHGEYEKVEAV